MTGLIKRFAANLAGRDFVVGDIHGHFSALAKALARVDFDPKADRLFSVGDLVDRGPESAQALDWLGCDWFHAVRGNHEDYACRFETCDRDNWRANGGGWFDGLARDEQHEFAAQFRELPLVIEVELKGGGMVGIVHAGSPVDDWHNLPAALETRAGRDACMWSRQRWEARDARPVRNIAAVVCGHEPLFDPARLGNTFFIDSCGWLPDAGGYFTLLGLPELSLYPAWAAVRRCPSEWGG